jgi:hypothetical protein
MWLDQQEQSVLAGAAGAGAAMANAYCNRSRPTTWRRTPDPDRGRANRIVVVFVSDSRNSGHAPSAVLLGKRDAILVVGCLVAKELGLQPPPVLFVEAANLASLRTKRVSISDNCITVLG